MKLTDQNFLTEISEIMKFETGVNINEKQTHMVIAIIQKRCLDLKIQGGLTEYQKYLHLNKKEETKFLVSNLTTHHTFFFREFTHFDFLIKKGLAEIVQAVKKEQRNTIKVWSAACSFGQEAYSISMFLYEHLKKIDPNMHYEIFGSDVDPDAVKIAQNGVFKWDEVKQIPSLYLGSHWVRGTGEISNFAKCKPSIKDPCSFAVENLFKLEKINKKKFDIIFCRNVIIYFNEEQIREIVKNLSHQLEPHGLFFLGVSENLPQHEMSLFNSLGASIYALKNNIIAQKTLEIKMIRVLCVDDSNTVLMLLKKILTPEKGFEVVGVAKNGFEAHDFLEKNTVDVVTLDIHMPECDGLSYLKKFYTASHPPVIMISSVSREDAHLGIQAIELGASDYVEKPSLENIIKRSDEIIFKIMSCLQVQKQNKESLMLTRSFKKSLHIQMPDSKVRIMIGSIAQKNTIHSTLNALEGDQPPTIILLYGSENILHSLKDNFKGGSFHSINIFNSSSFPLKANASYLGDFEKSFDEAFSSKEQKNYQIIVFGDIPAYISEKILNYPNATLLMEETQHPASTHMASLYKRAKTIVPYTSIGYESSKMFSS